MQHSWLWHVAGCGVSSMVCNVAQPRARKACASGGSEKLPTTTDVETSPEQQGLAAQRCMCRTAPPSSSLHPDCAATSCQAALAPSAGGAQAVDGFLKLVTWVRRWIL